MNESELVSKYEKKIDDIKHVKIKKNNIQEN
jgi:hypothetical protein